MSYITKFSLTAYRQDPDGVLHILTRDKMPSLDQAVKDMSRFDNPYDRMCIWDFEGSWGGYFDEMCLLSARFRGLLFELEGHGEDIFDHWILYFRDGLYQFCPGEIVYPPFQPSELRKPEILE